MSKALIAALLLTYVAVLLAAFAAGGAQAILNERRTGHLLEPFDTFAIRWVGGPLLLMGLACLPLGLIWAVLEAWRAAL